MQGKIGGTIPTKTASGTDAGAGMDTREREKDPRNVAGFTEVTMEVEEMSGETTPVVVKEMPLTYQGNQSEPRVRIVYC